MSHNENVSSNRIMIFVESFRGFGHFNVVDILGKGLVSKEGVRVSIVSSSFHCADGVYDYSYATKFKLPEIYRTPGDTGKGLREITKDGNELSSDSSYQNDIKEATKDALEKFDPEIIVFEFYPFAMAFRDITKDAIEEYYKSKQKPIMASLCRDITYSFGSGDKKVRKLNECFDYVFVRGDGKFVKLHHSEPEWKNIKIPVEYMGNFVTDIPERNKDIPKTDREVLVFSGGAFYRNGDMMFFQSIIKARKLSKHYAGNPMSVIVGQGISDDELQSIKSLALEESPEGNIKIMSPFAKPEFNRTLCDAACALVRSNYNTTFELALSGVPFVTIPRDWHAEQVLRAERWDHTGLAKKLDQSQIVEPGNVARALDEAEISRAASTVKLSFLGAENTALRIIELIMNRGTGESKTVKVNRPRICSKVFKSCILT